MKALKIRVLKQDMDLTDMNATSGFEKGFQDYSCDFKANWINLSD